MDASDIVDVLKSALPGVSIAVVEAIDMPTIVIDRRDVPAVFQTLRDHPSLQFALLVEVTAADYLPASPRFEVVYHLACIGEAFKRADVAAPPRRLRVKTRVPGDDPNVPSVTSLYPVAGWPEREIFDLVGIAFDGHPDLRRILTPEDWEGHPLRKDYPVQIRKDSVSWEPLQLTAEEFAANIREQRERAARDAARAAGRPDVE